MGEVREVDRDSGESQSSVEVIDLLAKMESLSKCKIVDSSRRL